MPTIVTPSIQNRPSGLDKFLSTLSGVTGAASDIASVIALPRRLRLEESRLATAEAAEERQQKTLELAQTKDEREQAGILLSTVVPRAFESRNNLFDAAEAGTLPLQFLNGPVDPSLRAAAVTIGDIPVNLREDVRAAAAIQLGVEKGTISNSFVLAERNFQGVLDRESLARNFAFMTDPANQEQITANESLARAREAGASEDTGEADILRDKLFSEAVNNELFRIDNTTGEVSGAAYHTPDPFFQMIAESQGLDWPIEFDDPVTGKRIFAPISLRDDIYRAYVDQLILQENDAAATVNDAAQELAEAGRMPLPTAVKFVTGAFDELTPEELQQYEPFVEGSRLAATAAVQTLMATSPAFRQFADAIQMVNDLGLPENERVKALKNFQNLLSQLHPESDIITVRNTGMLERLLSIGANDPGLVEFSGGRARPQLQPRPIGGEPGRAPVDLDQAIAGSNAPELLGADLNQAFAQSISPLIFSLVDSPDAVVDRVFERMIEEGIGGRVVTPLDIEAARELLNQIKQQGN